MTTPHEEQTREAAEAAGKAAGKAQDAAESIIAAVDRQTAGMRELAQAFREETAATHGARRRLLWVFAQGFITTVAAIALVIGVVYYNRQAHQNRRTLGNVNAAVNNSIKPLQNQLAADRSEINAQDYVLNSEAVPAIQTLAKELIAHGLPVPTIQLQAPPCFSSPQGCSSPTNPNPAPPKSSTSTTVPSHGSSTSTTG